MGTADRGRPSASVPGTRRRDRCQTPRGRPAGVEPARGVGDGPRLCPGADLRIHPGGREALVHRDTGCGRRDRRPCSDGHPRTPTQPGSTKSTFGVTDPSALSTGSWSRPSSSSIVALECAQRRGRCSSWSSPTLKWIDCDTSERDAAEEDEVASDAGVGDAALPRGTPA